MKRWLVLAAAAACVVAFASSAAAAPPAATHRIQPNVPIFADWYLGSGDWFTVDGGVLSPPSTDPIPPNEPFMVGVTWIGKSYGHTMQWPAVDQLSVTISDSDGTVVFSQTPAQARAAYTPVFVWDSYWSDVLGFYPGFNPKMGLATYGIDWETVVGGLPSGEYTAVVHEVFAHSYNDLAMAMYPAGPARPNHMYPYTADWAFTFTVG